MRIEQVAERPGAEISADVLLQIEAELNALGVKTLAGYPLPLDPEHAAEMLARALGGPGSGNFGHLGRPGKVGGSAPESSSTRVSYSPEELKEIERYVTGEWSGPEDLNASLRLEESDEFDPDYWDDESLASVKALDSAVAKSRLPQDTTVYRAVESQFVESLNEGDVFVDRGFVSTTLSEMSVDRIKDEWGAFGTSYTRVEIDLPTGTPALFVNDVPGMDFYEWQDEVLLGRGHKFRVLRKTDAGIVLKVEE